MAILQAVNLALRFALELCLLGALGFWGFSLGGGWPIRLTAGLGAPLLAAVVWGLFVAPKAAYLLADPWRFVLEFVLFALGAGALYLAARPSLAIALFLLFLLNRVLMMIWAQ